MKDNPLIPTAKILFDPPEDFALKNRLWQGCPTLECTPGGSVYGGWYSGGTREPSLHNYNVLYRSTDEGFSFPGKPLLVIAGDPEKNKIIIDIQLWCDPAGKLWCFWVERDCLLPKRAEKHLGNFAIVCENPDAETRDLIWSKPLFIGEGFLRCKPTLLSDGRWILPAYDWKSNFYSWSESSDQGKTFLRRQGPEKVDSIFDESMFYESKTGKGTVLRMLARTHQGYIAQSASSDGGISWSPCSRFQTAPGSRFFIRRLRSGRILLIYSTHPSKRTHLKAYLSEDEGRSWKGGLLLDDSENISYPDAAQLPDGSIILLYDHGRFTFREIVEARFTEKDILNEKIEETPFSRSYLRHIVSKAPVPADREKYDKLREEEGKWVQELIRIWEQ